MLKCTRERHRLPEVPGRYQPYGNRPRIWLQLAQNPTSSTFPMFQIVSLWSGPSRGSTMTFSSGPLLHRMRTILFCPKSTSIFPTILKKTNARHFRSSSQTATMKPVSDRFLYVFIRTEHTLPTHIALRSDILKIDNRNYSTYKIFT